MKIIKTNINNVPEKCPWATHVLELDKDNKMYLEGIGRDGLPNYRLRISWVSTTDKESFDEMVHFIEKYSKKNGYDNLYFSDTLSEDILAMFLSNGFTEKEVIGDENHYLIKKLK